MRYRPARHGQGRHLERQLVTDGGTPDDEGDEESNGTADDEPEPEPTDDTDLSNVEVMDAGEAEPADPMWEAPDIDDIPEFEVRADEPVVESGGAGTGGGSPSNSSTGDSAEEPTAGMPHDARAPGATTVSSQGTEAYVAALELCARLPDDVALPDEAADLVPAAVEAELEQDIQSFAAAEFDNAQPHVDTLSFEKIDDGIWLRIRIGLPAEGFDDLDPEELRSFALQELEGVL